jgi:hypothetical protein
MTTDPSVAVSHVSYRLFDWIPPRLTTSVAKNSFVRRVRSSLLGGKNPFLSQSKAAEKEKERQGTFIKQINQQAFGWFTSIHL